jgi:hypothetical protein
MLSSPWRRRKGTLFKIIKVIICKFIVIKWRIQSDELLELLGLLGLIGFRQKDSGVIGERLRGPDSKAQREALDCPHEVLDGLNVVDTERRF